MIGQRYSVAPRRYVVPSFAAAATLNSLRIGDEIHVTNKNVVDAQPAVMIVQDPTDGSYGNSELYWVNYTAYGEFGINDSNDPFPNLGFTNGVPQRLESRNTSGGFINLANMVGHFESNVQMMEVVDPRPADTSSGSIVGRYRFDVNASFLLSNNSSRWIFRMGKANPIGGGADQYAVTGAIVDRYENGMMNVSFSKSINLRHTERAFVGLERVNGGAFLTLHSLICNLTYIGDQKYLP